MLLWSWEIQEISTRRASSQWWCFETSCHGEGICWRRSVGKQTDVTTMSTKDTDIGMTTAPTLHEMNQYPCCLMKERSMADDHEPSYLMKEEYMVNNHDAINGVITGKIEGTGKREDKTKIKTRMTKIKRTEMRIDRKGWNRDVRWAHTPEKSKNVTELKLLKIIVF